MAAPKTDDRTESLIAAPAAPPGRPGAQSPGGPARAEQPDRLAELGWAVLEVAHEVRSSLGAIQLYASLLEQLSEDDRARGLARKVLSGMVHLSALVEDLLLWGETGTLNREECYLLDLVEQAFGFARPYLEEKSIRVTRLYAGELDSVRADACLLGSVFLNLILNAVVAMPGGGELVVTLRPEPPEGSSQEVRFEDTGPGFPPGILEHAFEPFFSGERAGAGLGLAVADRIMRAHGGSVDAANRRQGGAVVTVRLPVG